MKPHGPVRVARKWHGLCANPVLKCLNGPKGLNNGYLPSGHDPQVHKLANSLRLSTAVPSQDLSGA
jgi:hypothetical protein